MSDLNLNDVFEGTKTQEENSLPRLVTMIQVTERIDEKDVPSRLLVRVNDGEIIRYQNLAHLPVEVQNIINSISSGAIVVSKQTLLLRAKELLASIENLPDPPAKFKRGETVRIVEDEYGIMTNPKLIGRTGTIVDIIPVGKDHKYVVKVEGSDDLVRLIEDMLESCG